MISWSDTTRTYTGIHRERHPPLQSIVLLLRYDCYDCCCCYGMSSRSGARDSSAPGTTTTTTTTTTTASSVRPRTRRLISVDNEEGENTSEIMQPSSSALSSGLASDRRSARSRGNTPSPYTSRGASPLPMSHPSRVRAESGNRSKYEDGGGSGEFYYLLNT